MDRRTDGVPQTQVCNHLCSQTPVTRDHVSDCSPDPPPSPPPSASPQRTVCWRGRGMGLPPRGPHKVPPRRSPHPQYLPPTISLSLSLSVPCG